jgi:hypothetical protein
VLPKASQSTLPVDFPRQNLLNSPHMSLINLSVKTLRQAANLKEKIVALEKELSQVLGSTATPTAASPAPKKKFTMSAAAKAKISAAAKARWAKIKGAKTAVKVVKPAAAQPVKKARKKMSAAARARISAMAKARWAKAKAAGRKTL